MKSKYTLIALLAITLFGCDDNTGGLGLGMFPGSDQNINGKLTTFDVTSESVHAGKIYAMSNIGYVGKFTDNLFGTYQAGFLAELNCPDGVTFPKVYTEYDEDGNLASVTGKKAVRGEGTMIGEESDDIILIKDGDKVIGNIHTAELYLWYSSYFGDSLTASRLSVYELNQRIKVKDAYYTDIDAESYKGRLLGTKAYTAVDLSVKDSIRKLSGYVPSVHVAIDDATAVEIGGKIIKEARTEGGLNMNKFREAFKGIYVKNDFGDGTVLYVFQSQMNVVYKCYATDSITGLKKHKNVLENGVAKDSTYYDDRSFYSTREVIQANRLENDKEAIQDCIDNHELTYLKSPAGIFTQITLPVSEIAEKLQGDTLNAVRLAIPIYNQTNDKKFGMSIPRSVLLIRKKYKDSFFVKNELSDGITSTFKDYSSLTTPPTQYVFDNITQMVNSCLADGERDAAEKELKDKGSVTFTYIDTNGDSKTQTVNSIEEWEKLSDWNKVVLIPVLITTDSSTSTSSGTPNVISIQHDLKPSYAGLKGGLWGLNPKDHPDNVLKLEVVSTNFGTRAN
ncbi:DUF4270 domain-containing protein [uncultured Bacteroides sp.]|uniref:DUF4270 domain-containing protein n=1 Tax=uncultured Bacteroides sp. TaxID=162156 RepID=UPI0025F84E4B|nr:DUF4270 domain-containing protein [uncultured Bacteroides sp.]